jgi:hypothetical protein
MLTLILTTIPCHARENGCGDGNVVGVIVLVILFCGAVTGLLAWVWFRWERGPFWRLMNLLSGGWKRRGR